MRPLISLSVAGCTCPSRLRGPTTLPHTGCAKPTLAAIGSRAPGACTCVRAPVPRSPDWSCTASRGSPRFGFAFGMAVARSGSDLCVLVTTFRGAPDCSPHAGGQGGYTVRANVRRGAMMKNDIGKPSVLRGIGGFFGRTTVAVLGVGLMVLGVAMGVPLVMLPVGIGVGFAGAGLVAGGRPC